MIASSIEPGARDGVRDIGAVESAVFQPQMAFGGKELYPTMETKAAALCFSLVKNHPFIDGNKRVGHAAMETFLVLNGWELAAGTDDAEQTLVSVAAGNLRREQLVAWVGSHIRRLPASAELD